MALTEARIKSCVFLNKHRFTLTLGPFKKHYGFILGNMLRRMIISRMPGAAITQAKIPQASHEYELLEYMTEDLVVFLNRLKKVALSLPQGSVKQTLHVHITGPTLFTAGQLAVQGVSVSNPELVLASINQPIDLEFVFQIDLGYGYAPILVQQNNELVLEELDTSFLRLHAVFNPIRAVSFTVQHEDEQDIITLDVTTNGTIQPETTVMLAFKYFYQQLDLFRDVYHHTGHDDLISSHESSVTEPAPEDNLHSFSLASLELSVRAANGLKILNIHSMEELLQCSQAQILKAQGVGKKSLQEIILALDRYGLSLKAKQENI
jgi:DNA-directed RNA polymerase subunit alpha